MKVQQSTGMPGNACVYSLAVLACDNLTLLYDHANVDGSESILGSEARVECDVGYAFDAHQPSNNTVDLYCAGDRRWALVDTSAFTSVPEACLGM